MKILQVVSTLFPGGAEHLVVELSKKFVKSGHEVDILALKSLDIDLSDRLGPDSNVGVYSFGESNNIYSPKCIRQISKFASEHDYDIVHVHLFPALYWVAIAKSSFRNGKLIFTEHNTHNKRREKFYFKFLDRWIYKKYDRIIAISDKARNNLNAHLKSSSSKVVTILNGVDLNKISEALPYSKEELGLPSDSKLLIQVSHFRDQKNQKTLIEALHKLDQNVHLILVGDGPRIDDHKELARQLNLEKQVHFYGLRSDVPRLLKTADIVVLSTHHEGLSLSSVEGMASGKPFVASEVEGLAEVVRDAGILFADNDDAGLAEILKSLLLDEELRMKTVASCLERAKKYDIQLMVENHINLYKETLG